MDPRLTPRQAPVRPPMPPGRQEINSPPQAPSAIVNPIAQAVTEEIKPTTPITPAPAATPAPPPPPVSQAPEPLKTEMVSSIPVKQQGQNQSVTPAPPQHKLDITEGHDELDQILQAVNSRVKSPQAAPKTAKKPKIQIKLPKLAGGSKATGVAIAAIVVAVALSSVAVWAYRQEKHTLASQPGKVGTTSSASDAVQSAGGALVHPSDLDDYSQTLQTKLNSLNDSQDFDNNSLSDKMLGL